MHLRPSGLWLSELCAIPVKGNLLLGGASSSLAPHRRSRPEAPPIKGSLLGSVPKAAVLLGWCRMLCVSRLDSFAPLYNFTPSHPDEGFCPSSSHVNSKLSYLAERVLPHVVAVLSSRLLPAFIGSDLFTTTGSSATSHHFGLFLTQILNSHYQLLTLRLWEDSRGLDDARLPQLLCRLPVDDYVLKHLL